MPRLTAPSSIKAVHLHAPVGAAYIVFAIIALLHAVVLQWMYSTVGMPYANAVEQNERIQATNSLHMGFSERNLLKLQSGLTRAADLDTFNETLFDDSKSLYRALSKRSEALAKASIGPATRPLAAALDAAIEPHTDGRPYVERKQLKGYLKKLGELSKPKMAAPDAAPEPVDEKEMLSESELSATVEKVKAAIELSRGSEDEVEEEEDEKKLPSKWLPSFWACLAFFGCILVGVITHMGTYWSVAFNAIMYYHPTWAVQVGSYARVVPPQHRGTAEIVPLQVSSSGQLFFLHQRQKYEVVTDDEEIESGHVGLCRPLLCPISLPLKEYASSDGLQSVTQIERTFEEFGENSFAIPMPTWLDLYKEQLASRSPSSSSYAAFYGCSTSIGSTSLHALRSWHSKAPRLLAPQEHAAATRHVAEGLLVVRVQAPRVDQDRVDRSTTARHYLARACSGGRADVRPRRLRVAPWRCGRQRKHSHWRVGPAAQGSDCCGRAVCG